MSEAEFTRDVCGVADSLGLLWHHCGDSRRCTGNRGFPDLFAAGENGLIAAELKMPAGDLSAEQQLWAWTLTRSCRVAWRLWTPADLESDAISWDLKTVR